VSNVIKYFIWGDNNVRIELVLRLWGKAEVSWIDPKKSQQKRPPRPKTSATPEIRISHIQDPVSPDSTNEKMFSNEETYFDRRHTVLEKSKEGRPVRNEVVMLFFFLKRGTV
jgi:hypothetical protein